MPIELVHRDEAELTLLTAEGASRRTSQTRIKGEIWEKWGAAYGRNGWVGEKEHPEKQEYKVSYGKSGVRHMGEMGWWAKKKKQE